MKAVKFIQYFALISILALTVTAQQTQPTPKRERIAKAETEVKPDIAATTEPAPADVKTDTTVTEAKPESSSMPKQEESSDAVKTKSDAAAEQTVTPNAPSEEKEILSYYKSYLDNYPLNPTDVISIEVFGQCPNYCKSNITVPPTGKISYPLIKGGVFVAGKTIEQVEEEIKTKLDEYIIDPNVTVTLDKAMSVRYSVLGKVATPGVRVMERRMTVYEAIVEAGGITKEGNQKKVVLYRYDPKGNLTSQIINLEAIERGKSPMIELQAGDQVFVADKGFQFNMEGVFSVLQKASIVRLLFGSPF